MSAAPAGAPAHPTFVSPAPFLATTSNALDGYDVVEVLGVVRGITVRSRSMVGMMGAALQVLRGGEISLLTQLCEQTRGRAYELAVEHARALGANALIALRYDATEIMSGVSEVLCYGTAARVARRAAGEATSPGGGALGGSAEAPGSNVPRGRG